MEARPGEAVRDRVVDQDVVARREAAPAVGGRDQAGDVAQGHDQPQGEIVGVHPARAGVAVVVPGLEPQVHLVEHAAQPP